MNLGRSLILTLGIFQLLYAQDSFQVELSANKIGLEDTLSVYVTTTTAKTYFQDQPQINSKDFEILPSISNSTSIQIINGKTSFSQTYTYLLKPKTTGALSFSTSFAGGSKNSSVEVVSGSIAPQSGIPNQALSPWDPDEDSDKKSPPPIIRYTLSKPHPYLNEPIFVNYYYYEPFGQGTPENIAMEDAPSLIGGILSALPKLNKKEALNAVKIDGNLYTPHRLLQQILIPLKTNLIFDPGSLSVDLLSSSYISLNPEHLKLKITGPSISAKKPPIEPKDFSNIFASKLSLTSELTQDTYQVNKPIVYSIHLKANGNLRFFSPPKLTLEEADVNLVEDKLKETPNNDQSIIDAEKTLTYYIIPRKEGDLLVSPLNFTFFNYEKARYENLWTKPLHIEVKINHQTLATPPEIIDSPTMPSYKKDLSKKIPLKYFQFMFFSLSFIVLALIVFYFVKNLKKKRDGINVGNILQKIQNKINADEDMLSIINFYLFNLAEKNHIENLSKSVIIEKLSQIYPLQSSLFIALKDLNGEIEHRKFAPHPPNNTQKKEGEHLLEILQQIHKNKDIRV